MGENLNIQSSEISIDKKTLLTIFKGAVVATDYKNNVFKSDINCVDSVIKWLSNKKNHNKTPWILLLNILKPHFPHLVTKDLWELYDSYKDVHKYNLTNNMLLKRR